LGATVWMTHMGVTNLGLAGRAAVANLSSSHLLISIHTNASTVRSVSGHSVYYYAPADNLRLADQRSQRQALAAFVLGGVVEICGRRDLGVVEANFGVIRETNCPSVLIETAFISNREEEALLAQGYFRQQLAQGIADGILRYFDDSPDGN